MDNPATGMIRECKAFVFTFAHEFIDYEVVSSIDCRDQMYFMTYINVGENRRVIYNGHSRDTSNIVHKTQNEDKQNKQHRRTNKTNT